MKKAIPYIIIIALSFAYLHQIKLTREQKKNFEIALKQLNRFQLRCEDLEDRLDDIEYSFEYRNTNDEE